MLAKNSARRIATCRPVALPAALLLLFASGCGYLVGAPYQSEVRSVHVPIFTTDSPRRDFEYQLTEAVQKQIKLRTPFRLAKGPDADTRLVGQISEVRKEALGETAFDDPRELELRLAVKVTWEDLRTGRILEERQVDISPNVVHLISEASFAPEVGQSQATATQTAVDELARQIVGMMEAPW